MLDAAMLRPSLPALLAAGAIGLVLTLALCAHLTPARWWRRPNARALALTAGGTLLFGLLLVPVFGRLFGAARPPAQFAAPFAPAPLAPPAPPAASRPAHGASYLVVADLNLRVETGTGAPRVTVLRAGSRVTASGQASGDWWRVRARAGGRELDGWASSLWLRRIDEAGNGQH